MLKVLVLNPTKYFFPPTSGGSLRLFYLLREMAKHFELHLISYREQDLTNSEMVESYEYPSSMNVYGPDSFQKKRTIFDLMPKRLGNALKSRWITGSLLAPADDFSLKMSDVLTSLLQSNNYDVIVYEHAITLSCSNLVDKYAPNSFKVLNAYNVDSQLEAQKNKFGESVSQRSYRRLVHLESNLHKFVQQVWVCSEDDKAEFTRMNKKTIDIQVVPNGVDVMLNSFEDSKTDQSKELLFCGGLNYHPNFDGLVWFLKEIYPKVKEKNPEVRLTLVGKCMDLLDDSLLDDSVTITGFVDSVLPYYRKCMLAIVPLRIGSGTRLKILEAMSLGVPVVSTPIGAMGIDHSEGENILIGKDADEMTAKIVDLINDPERVNAIGLSARTLVEEKYDWRKIGENIVSNLEEVKSN